MSLNGINSNYAGNNTVSSSVEATKKTESTSSKKSDSAASKSENGATYESTISTTTSKKAKNAAIVAQMKADTEKRAAQMQIGRAHV